MDSNRSQSPQSRRTRSPNRTLAEVALATLAGGATIAGCTFVNSFGEVKPNGSTTDSGVGETGRPDSTPSESSPPVDTGNDTPVTPTDTGLVVFAGHAGASPKLVVLEAATGKELAREDLAVSAILYEGDATRDVWYIIEKTGAATDKLHVREWDTTALKWKADLGTADVPPVLDRDAVAMLAREIAYLTPKSDSPSGLGLALLSTNTVTDVTAIASGVANFPGTKPLGAAAPLGMIGSPSAVSTGGFLNFPRKQGCGAGDAGPSTCELSMLNVIVPKDYAAPLFNAPDVGLGIFLDSTETKVRANFGWNPNGPEDLVAYGTLGDPSARLLRVSPSSNVVSATSHFDVSGDTQRNFSLLTVSQCHGIAFVPELQSFNIHMVSVKSDKSFGTQGAGHQAQRVVFEPYTDTLLAPLETGSGASITALALTVAGDGTPTLTPRTSGWDPPKDVQPDVTVTRSPSNFDCTKKR